MGDDLWEGCQQGGGLGVVAKGFAYVDEILFTTGAENETAAELQWIFAQPSWAISGGLGAFACNHIVFAKQMKKTGLFQFEGAVCFATLVDQQRKLDPSFFAEGLCILRITQAYCGQVRSLVAKCRFKFAQLRNVLAAEDSTVMTQEDQHHWLLGPQRAESNRMAIAIGQGDICQAAAIGVIHGKPFS